MALVAYSDSEGSDDEVQAKPAQKPAATKPTTSTSSAFSVDRSNPRKIQVNLQNKPDPTSNNSHEDEPAPKRPRMGAGGGAFSGFNSMLPAPKRDNMPKPSQGGDSKTAARKVFSLKTGAEAAFSRESDHELKQLFAEQRALPLGNGDVGSESMIPSTIPKNNIPAFAKPPPPSKATGNPFLFKPLSVSRNQKKKKPVNASTANTSLSTQSTIQPTDKKRAMLDETQLSEQPAPVKQKISLFSAGTTNGPDEAPQFNDYKDPEPEIEQEDGFGDIDAVENAIEYDDPPPQSRPDSNAQSLDSIADTLNLSAAEKRQLFGRPGAANRNNKSAVNVVNFNTDAEYAANQQLIAQGEQVQHNPVRAIAPGKHSLRQLVNAASGQKDALEESFVRGKNNKKEAGSKYGW